MTRWLAAALLLSGCGARGQLGLPDTEATTNVGVQVASLTLGYDHTCALLDDGTAWCWGTDSYSELGDAPATASRATPLALASPTGIAALSASYGFTCAVLRDETLWCWGRPNLGGFGDGPAAPAAVATGIAGVGAGFSYACTVGLDGVVSCWGSDNHGQTGNTTGTSYQPSLTPVQGTAHAVAVAAGQFVTCALGQDGSVSCWGLGPLGDGSMGDSAKPVTVAGLAGPAQQIAVGSQHACALLADGSVACWGYGGYGELGLGVEVVWAPLPTTLTGLPPARAISACDLHTCAILTDGTARCWGNNSAVSQGSFTPVAVPGINSAVAIASGQSHDCALRDDGRVLCWGQNGSGQLGDGTTTSSASPVEVVGLP